MKFLVNPTRKKKRVGRFKKGSAAAKRYMASIRPHTKGGSTVAKRRRKVSKKRITRRRPKAIVAINPPRRRHAYRSNAPARRRYRPNPSVGGLFKYLSVNNLLNGVIDTGEVLVGKVVVKTLPGMVGLPTTDAMGLGVQALTAILAGGAAHTFVNANAGKMVLAGGLLAPMETLLRSLNIPMVSAALGEDIVEIDGMQAYPQQVEDGRMGSYVQYGEDMEYNYAQ